jgi:3-carboxy-cis,cis-muconate cycloisomerase
MPHKQNPVGAIAVVACAQRSPGLVATLLASMAHEHERAAGAWQAEWEPLLELLRLTGSAAAALAELLGGLAVDPERMRSNLDLTRALVMSESAVSALAESVGGARAQQLVTEAARQPAAQHRSLRDVLLEEPEVAEAVGAEHLARALAPESYLGVAGDLIDRALRAHRRGGDEH